MATVSQLDLECLEYQTGFLGGLVLSSWGEPEQMNRYASRYAIVLASLGRVKESDYQAGIAATAARFIGRSARKAWTERPRHLRLLARPGDQHRWEQAHTDGLFLEADDHLRRISDDVADFRDNIANHFGPSSPAADEVEEEVQHRRTHDGHGNH
ncbi:hypothetical protein [Arthrobacter sp. UYCo732]|uniref:hypothetical protein n=1 Tax=Arthrobacter sp. UYCo732 TaxID=3156336 RepID=UPI0033928710